MERLTRHHTLYPKPEFCRNRFLNSIRNHRGLIIPLPMLEVHRPLHISFLDGVPPPDLTAAKAFNEIVLPYELGQPWHRTLDQAIGFFEMTANFGTADALAAQREFIGERINLREVA